MKIIPSSKILFPTLLIFRPIYFVENEEPTTQSKEKETLEVPTNFLNNWINMEEDGLNTNYLYIVST